MCRVIIYKSKTGHTERYARMLSKELHIPCYSYKDAKVSENDEIIFLSYIYASKIMGLSKKITICTVWLIILLAIFFFSFK